ncbi:Endonuclease/exonuclease/phosphatase [Favolaschia claudopus]|uniref:Endonuclease/exonuclease/phosphatase n=1 Tax=Favolaschia claudopus TaxID=2862362 RepID=A0AAW0EAX7_9AGAR
MWALNQLKTAATSISRFAAPDSLRTLYSYNVQNGWVPSKSPLQTAASGSNTATYQPFALLTWNVDFVRPLIHERFQAALSHLEELLSPQKVTPAPQPTIIFMQEVHSSCFEVLLASDFIREFYEPTNISSLQKYSTLTLVPKSLVSQVACVQRTPFTGATVMDRDCLYVDLHVRLPATPEQKALRLRIANTHLESLGFGLEARSTQLQRISGLLTETGIDGGFVAGDMNAISEADNALPEQYGLTDAWKEEHFTPTDIVDSSGTGEIEGHTWGYQPPAQFPPDRLDKILVVGKLAAVDVQRVGVGLKVKDTDTWVSDHYGLLAKIVLRM